MQLLGDKVRKYRRQKGWSQEQLGELVGFSQSKISKIEMPFSCRDMFLYLPMKLTKRSTNDIITSINRK